MFRGHINELVLIDLCLEQKNQNGKLKQVQW